ncbi:unnamed protein product, partial [Staurois parvus]
GLAPLGSGYLNLTGTRSHFWSDLLGDQKQKVSYLPVVFGTHDRSQKTTAPFMKRSATCACAVGTGCKAASCHSRVPTLKMPAP